MKITDNNGFTIKQLLFAVLGVFMLIAALTIVDIHTVDGNEIGVKETWADGVVEDSFPPKTYILFPGFSQNIINYDLSQQMYVMNDRGGEEAAEGRPQDSYLVQSSEGQDMRISMAVQWRRDPLKVIELHKTVGENVEEKILRPELMRTVKDKATSLEALIAYSGPGLVGLQSDIQRALQNPDGDLRKRGVIVDNFVIEHIGLDPEYVGEIKGKQIAIQTRLRNIEETKAAEAAAEKAKAEAQANYEKVIVEAERDKQQGILEAEKIAQQKILDAGAKAKEVTLAAQAEKERRVLDAEGEKEAGELRAAAIIAVGQAEAEAQKLKLSAYAVPGAEAFVRIQVAASMSEAFQNIQGYLPENMSINLLAESYDKGVSLLVNGDKTAPNTNQ